MAVSVTHLLEDSEVDEYADNKTAKNVYLVTGLEHGTNILTLARKAVDAVTKLRVPRIYDPHQAEPDIFAWHKSPRLFLEKSKTACKVAVYYKPPDFSFPASGTIVTYNATTRDVTTNFDADGKKIVVQYLAPGQGGIGQYLNYVGRVGALKAFGILQYRRFENQVPQVARTHINKLNSIQWNGGAKYTWLCRDIQFERVWNESAQYMVTYVFEYDEDTHIKTAAYRDLSDAVPQDVDDIAIPKVLTSGNGYKNVLTAKERDFNQLQLEPVFG